MLKPLQKRVNHPFDERFLCGEVVEYASFTEACSPRNCLDSQMSDSITLHNPASRCYDRLLRCFHCHSMSIPSGRYSCKAKGASEQRLVKATCNHCHMSSVQSVDK